MKPPFRSSAAACAASWRSSRLDATAVSVKASLEKQGLLSPQHKTGSRIFFSSDDEGRFKDMSRQFLGWKAMQVHRVRWS